ncbi:unnamed protein product [Closterium sp. Yama58-4]|nr:unnamed protein product [Closterium sp. Yama58-4]
MIGLPLLEELIPFPQTLHRLRYRSRQRGFLELLTEPAAGWELMHLTPLPRRTPRTLLALTLPPQAALSQQAEGLPGAGPAAGQVGGAFFPHLIAPCSVRPSSHSLPAPHRLRYRSRQRGFLELDLLLGKWVEEHLPSLDASHLSALARLMDEESPDLFKWFTGQERAPQHVSQNPVYVSIRSKVEERLHRMHPAVKATPGLPWVRGWEDIQRQPGAPPAGNQ